MHKEAATLVQPPVCQPTWHVLCRQLRASAFIESIRTARRLTLAVLPILAACMPETLSQETQYVQNYYQQQGTPTFVVLDEGDLKLRYISTGAATAAVGNKKASTILFLHGTPGDWSAFARYLNDEALQRSARLVSVDRPGWGESVLVEGGVMAELEQQAQALKPLLDVLAVDDPNHRLLLVGHSLGASLAARIAMSYPERIDGLVLIAGALDPELGKPRWYNHLSATPGFRWLINTMSRDMGKANLEIMPMHEQLEAMRPYWRTLQIPITVIQGETDKLVYPANADFAIREIAADLIEMVRVPNQGHFLLWTEHDLVRKQILATLARAEDLPESLSGKSSHSSLSMIGDP